MKTHERGQRRSESSNEKSESQKHEAPCEYRHVLAVLATPDGLRESVLAEFRRRGGHPNRWRENSTRLAMAHALTQAEDAYEMKPRGQWTELRSSLRDMRRRLEASVQE
jgi:hypothetical protein